MWRLTTGLSHAVAAQVAGRLGRGLRHGSRPARPVGPPGPDRSAGRRWHGDLVGGAYPPLLTTSPLLDPDPSPRLLQTGPWADPAPARPLDRPVADWLERHPGAVLMTLGSLPLTSPQAQALSLIHI